MDIKPHDFSALYNVTTHTTSTYIDIHKAVTKNIIDKQTPLF